jgi:hypothetical protein
MYLEDAMLMLYRRHRANCKLSSRNAKCVCPIWVQGSVHGESKRRSLDMTNMAAATKLKDQWKIHRMAQSVLLKDTYDRYLENHRVNNSAADTVQKRRRLKKLITLVPPPALVCVSTAWTFCP